MSNNELIGFGLFIVFFFGSLFFIAWLAKYWDVFGDKK